MAKKKTHEEKANKQIFLSALFKICNDRIKNYNIFDDVNYVNEILYKFYLNKNFILSTNLFGEKLIKYFDLEETKYYKKAKNNKKTYFFLYSLKINLKILLCYLCFIKVLVIINHKLKVK